MFLHGHGLRGCDYHVSINGDGIIVSAVIGMGTSLKLRLIAEGVENPAQLAFLQAQHCEEGQGYFFSQPLVAPQFALLLAAGIDLHPYAVPFLSSEGWRKGNW